MKSRPSKPGSSKKLSKPKVALSGTDSFPIVAIGASAGGLEAYKEFFHALPPDTGMAFVLIQHLDPSHESMLTEIIAKTTTLPVEEVKSGTPIRPDHVYVIPPNSLMALADGLFRLSPRGKTPGRLTPYGTAVRRTCSRREQICAPSKCCSVMWTSRPRQDISICRNDTCRQCRIR